MVLKAKEAAGVSAVNAYPRYTLTNEHEENIMTFKAGKFKVRVTVRKDGSLVIEIESWERKGGLTPPAPKHNCGLIT